MAAPKARKSNQETQERQDAALAIQSMARRSAAREHAARRQQEATDAANRATSRLAKDAAGNRGSSHNEWFELPLQMRAAPQQVAQAVDALIDLGCDPSRADLSGRTSLHWLCSASFAKVQTQSSRGCIAHIRGMSADAPELIRSLHKMMLAGCPTGSGDIRG